MDCSTPGFPVLHHLPELAQTHVHRIGDAIQPSHPLSSPPPPAFNLSQHQGLANQLFASGSQSNRTWASASDLPTNIPGWFPLELTGLIALLNLSPSLTAHQPFEPSVYAWSTSAHSDLRSCAPQFPLPGTLFPGSSVFLRRDLTNVQASRLSTSPDVTVLESF